MIKYIVSLIFIFNIGGVLVQKIELNSINKSLNINCSEIESSVCYNENTISPPPIDYNKMIIYFKTKESDDKIIEVSFPNTNILLSCLANQPIQIWQKLFNDNNYINYYPQQRWKTKQGRCSGEYYLESVACPSLYLTVPSQNLTDCQNGNPISSPLTLQPLDVNSNRQIWKFQVGSSTFIESMHCPSYCITVPNSNYINGQRLILAHKGANNNQRKKQKFKAIKLSFYQ